MLLPTNSVKALSMKALRNQDQPYNNILPTTTVQSIFTCVDPSSLTKSGGRNLGNWGVVKTRELERKEEAWCP